MNRNCPDCGNDCALCEVTTDWFEESIPEGHNEEKREVNDG